ncbi:MAG TPA: NACHT domain-containing protein [Verrucomicrobiae bacterium]|jgi:hypothetical protein|nr:NACHT domain-containing protein [Verrucomicrobiae bacterium]
MEEDKRKRLEAIRDEVAEFHPLLKLLLPNITHVKTVEYTHGANEMGADFVLSRAEETFDQIEYITVVAKVGKIDQSAITDIDRQVDESFIPKFFDSGKQKVNISEAWVISTLGISHGAKEKIFEKNRGRKIIFIAGDMLAKLIDKYVPNFWTDIPLQIGDYLNNLRIRSDELDRSVSLAKNHADLYVEQDIYAIQEKCWETVNTQRKKRQKVDIYQTVLREKVLLIEGEMGAGKSKLLRQLIRHFTHPQHFLASNVVPIILSYKHLMDNYAGDLQRVVTDYVNKGALSELKENSRILFLIDGVDEKNVEVEEQLRLLSTLMNVVHANAKFCAVITSRYLGSIKQNWDLLRQSQRLEIRPLSTQRVIEFVQKLCSGANLSKRILEDLKKSNLFKELPKSPISAILLANLLQENTKEIPSNMTELYSKYLELVLGRWDLEKGLQTQKEYEALDNILMRIASFVIENELHYMSIDDAKTIVNDYLGPRNLGIDSARLFDILTVRAGIIMVDSLEKRMCFKHKTFAEYFYAKKKLREGGLVVDSRVFKLYWMNTFFFFAGLLKDCPDLLEAILAQQTESEGAKLLKMINMGNYFMAGSSSPYGVIERGLIKVIKEAAIYYNQIVNRAIESELSGFSEMHLLCVFQGILRDSYAYSFFEKAIEVAALEIDGSDLTQKDKATALFFLNVIYIDLGGKDSFDFILSKYEKELPLSIQLAIHHESSEIKNKTALLKRQEKSLMKSIRSNKSLKDHLDIMYDRPIRSLKVKIT